MRALTLRQTALLTLLLMTLACAAVAETPDDNDMVVGVRPNAPKESPFTGLVQSLTKTDGKIGNDLLTGCWQEMNDRNHLLHFLGDRIVESSGDLLLVYNAQAVGQNLRLDNLWHGTSLAVGYELLQPKALNATFKLIVGDVRKTFKRLDKYPDVLDLKPLSVPVAQPLPADKIKQIQADFRNRQTTDQGVQAGPVQRQDSNQAANTATLKKLIADVGWIDTQRFGAETSQTAILIALNSSDPPLMLTALLQAEPDALAARVDLSLYAKLYDRTALNLGRKQRFGTQTTVRVLEDGVSPPLMLPLEDPARVNAWRADVGLPPLTLEKKTK